MPTFLGRERLEEGEHRRMDEVKTLEAEQDDREQVEGWRLHILIEAGYPLPLAERIAHSGADLHEAVDLITRRGCRPELAAEILL